MIEDKIIIPVHEIDDLLEEIEEEVHISFTEHSTKKICLEIDGKFYAISKKSIKLIDKFFEN